MVTPITSGIFDLDYIFGQHVTLDAKNHAQNVINK
jgi:hypothetical protein